MDYIRHFYMHNNNPTRWMYCVIIWFILLKNKLREDWNLCHIHQENALHIVFAQ